MNISKNVTSNGAGLEFIDRPGGKPKQNVLAWDGD